MIFSACVGAESPRPPKGFVGGVYAIVCQESGKIYIGGTGDIRRRWRAHYSALFVRKDHVNPHLLASANRYGARGFCFCVVELCGESDVWERERAWIRFYKADFSEFGFNCSDGGEAPIFSEPTRQKISAALLGRAKSASHRASMSRARKGVPLSEEQAARLRALAVGRKPSAKNLEALRRSNLGRKKSPEELEKIASAHRGIPLSPEHRAKLSAARLGRKFGPRPRWLVEKVRSAQLRAYKIRAAAARSAA